MKTLRNSDVRTALDKQFIFFELDVDKEKEAARWFGGKAIPETIVLSSEGTIIDRIVGFIGPKEFLERVSKHSGQK